MFIVYRETFLFSFVNDKKSSYSKIPDTSNDQCVKCLKAKSEENHIIATRIWSYEI